MKSAGRRQTRAISLLEDHDHPEQPDVPEDEPSVGGVDAEKLSERLSHDEHARGDRREACPPQRGRAQSVQKGRETPRDGDREGLGKKQEVDREDHGRETVKAAVLGQEEVEGRADRQSEVDRATEAEQQGTASSTNRVDQMAATTAHSSRGSTR